MEWEGETNICYGEPLGSGGCLSSQHNPAYPDFPIPLPLTTAALSPKHEYLSAIDMLRKIPVDSKKKFIMKGKDKGVVKLGSINHRLSLSAPI